MPSRYYIFDLLVEPNFNRYGYTQIQIGSIGKTVMVNDQRNDFGALCRHMPEYSEQEIYNSIIGKLVSMGLINDDELRDTLFNPNHGYFGDMVSPDKVREIENERQRKRQEKENADRKAVNLLNLSFNFWGKHIVKDILP